ncbi:type VI secretion system tip protein TssI/VgrG [Pseudomonas quasicaspiana]|uniref:type VI secretion system tip protein TssI/VgrG n=1 Tax=Pseudomonas quasicaspiana TaxID=2829821 RepID=UPI001E657778|nr:type VI secretion system tip protein TssI/VgrG [Pseudomonas quasicaspiana]MCD5979482.1 type VI secretion system tip protein VgrG [Pseudomonas quasicaspiana]
MLNPANRASFTLEIAGLEHDFRVLAFTAKESISRPFSVRLELVSERANLKLEELLHRLAFLRFDADGNGLHGQIGEIAQGDSGKRFTHYFIQLVPSLKRLEYRSNHRIFQGKTVPEIIALVLKDHAIFSNGFAFRLREPCKPRDYCTQYQETDLHFVRRLCEEEGIHFHFQHSPDEHLLVFADDPIQLPVLKAAVAYVQSSGQVADASVIKRFNVRLATRSGKASHQTYHFQLPQVDLLSSAGGDGRKELEDYQYPAPFTDLSVGTRQAQKALERNRSDVRLAGGNSDQSALLSGHLFELTHPNPAWSQQWLLTSMFHEGKQPQVLEESMPRASGAFTQGYRNRFEAIPGNVPFRPPLRHRKPRVLGCQHAVVTGPPGEEIYCDDYGRIKVKFFWDREGSRNEHSSCWLRVATGWAHEQYGSVMIPRVGMEVIVGYFEADPDQPYVQACLPNTGTRAPLNLPVQNTQTVLKTQSSPGGAGFNELSIEDRKGAESISIRAQRNWSEHVLNDQSIQVDNQRQVKVTGLSSHELHGEEHHLTHGARKTQVLADDSLTVVGNQHISVANHLVSAVQEIHLSAGQNMIVDATLSTTIKAGGHWISITPAGIFTSVPILLGGVPLLGMPAVPLPPVPLEKRVAVPGGPSTPVMDVSVQALRDEFEVLPARCEACEAAKAEDLAQGG